jgi:hypothetical protein
MEHSFIELCITLAPKTAGSSNTRWKKYQVQSVWGKREAEIVFESKRWKTRPLWKIYCSRFKKLMPLFCCYVWLTLSLQEFWKSLLSRGQWYELRRIWAKLAIYLKLGTVDGNQNENLNISFKSIVTIHNKTTYLHIQGMQ